MINVLTRVFVIVPIMDFFVLVFFVCKAGRGWLWADMGEDSRKECMVRAMVYHVSFSLLPLCLLSLVFDMVVIG